MKMQHRIINVDHHRNIHEGSEVFDITFAAGGETHQMLGAYIPEDSYLDEEPSTIEVTHNCQLDADSEMDEHVMESMARDLIQHWYLFMEEFDTVPELRCPMCGHDEWHVIEGDLACHSCDVTFGTLHGTMSPIEFDITNERYTAREEFLVCNYSGAHEDLPPRVKELLTVQQMEELDAGDWIVIADGEIVSTGEFAPHTINYA